MGPAIDDGFETGKLPPEEAVEGAETMDEVEEDDPEIGHVDTEDDEDADSDDD